MYKRMEGKVMGTYTDRPCRQCGKPVIGTVGGADHLSFCCSRLKCIKKDDAAGMTNKDKPLVEISEEKYKRQMVLDSRGY